MVLFVLSSSSLSNARAKVQAESLGTCDKCMRSLKFSVGAFRRANLKSEILSIAQINCSLKLHAKANAKELEFDFLRIEKKRNRKPLTPLEQRFMNIF